MASFQPPVTLHGRWLDLVPLERAHAAPLAEAAADPEVWRFFYHRWPQDAGAMGERIDELLEAQAAGSDLAFAVVRRADQRPVGMTRFLDIQRAHESVEVGGTWFARDLWRTPFNSESKRLMLGYAFETERVHRVQLKTDLRNERSQRAIERLGATREGLLREHIRTDSGYRRSSVYYSVLADEWPAVRARLDRFLARNWDGVSSPSAAVPADPGR